MTTAPGERVAAGWVPEPDTFADRLVLVRKKKGWYTADLASRNYGFRSKEAYRTWEKGKVLPRNMVEICLRISNITGVDFGWLYGGPKMTGMSPAEVISMDQELEENTPPKSLPAGRDDIPAGRAHDPLDLVQDGHPVDHGRPAGRPRASTRPADGRPARLPRRTAPGA